MKFVQRVIVLIFFSFIFNTVLIAAEYKIAVRAHHGIKDAQRQWQPTINALSKSLPKHSFILVPIVSLNEISKRVGQNFYHV